MRPMREKEKKKRGNQGFRQQTTQNFFFYNKQQTTKKDYCFVLGKNRRKKEEIALVFTKGQREKSFNPQQHKRKKLDFSTNKRREKRREVWRYQRNSIKGNTVAKKSKTLTILSWERERGKRGKRVGSLFCDFFLFQNSLAAFSHSLKKFFICDASQKLEIYF